MVWFSARSPSTPMSALLGGAALVWAAGTAPAPTALAPTALAPTALAPTALAPTALAPAGARVDAAAAPEQHQIHTTTSPIRTLSGGIPLASNDPRPRDPGSGNNTPDTPGRSLNQQSGGSGAEQRHPVGGGQGAREGQTSGGGGSSSKPRGGAQGAQPDEQAGAGSSQKPQGASQGGAKGASGGDSGQLMAAIQKFVSGILAGVAKMFG